MSWGVGGAKDRKKSIQRFAVRPRLNVGEVCMQEMVQWVFEDQKTPRKSENEQERGRDETCPKVNPSGDAPKL